MQYSQPLGTEGIKLLQGFLIKNEYMPEGFANGVWDTRTAAAYQRYLINNQLPFNAASPQPSVWGMVPASIVEQMERKEEAAVPPPPTPTPTKPQRKTPRMIPDPVPEPAPEPAPEPPAQEPVQAAEVKVESTDSSEEKKPEGE